SEKVPAERMRHEESSGGRPDRPRLDGRSVPGQEVRKKGRGRRRQEPRADAWGSGDFREWGFTSLVLKLHLEVDGEVFQRAGIPERDWLPAWDAPGHDVPVLSAMCSRREHARD